MRLTLVSPFDPDPPAQRHGEAHVGGVERVFADVSRHLAGRGHDVTVICSTDGEGGETTKNGVRVVRGRRRGTMFRTPLVSLAPLVPQDSDVVHVAATYPFTTPGILKAAHRRGIPSVLDFHFEPRPAGAVGRLAAAVYRSVGPPSYRLADAVLVRSYSYARSAPSLARVPEERWRIVPNGIDPARFRPMGPAGEGDYLLFVGRLVPYKGIEVLLHAYARSPLALPLIIAGEGPSRAPLEALARRLRIDARFIGRVPDDELPRLYRGARATVLPSVNQQEAFGLCLAESMACGTPVVASRLPGVEDVAALGGGLLARPGDAQELATALLQASVPGALPRGSLLADRAHAAYSWDVVADRLLAVYQEVAHGRRSSPREVMTHADPGRHPVL